MNKHLNPIDLELVAPLEAMPKTRYGAMDLSDIPAARQTVREMAAQMSDLLVDDPTVTIATIEVDRAEGPPVPVRIFRPIDDRQALPCIVWFFAGGQIVGGADQDDAYLKALSRSAGGAVVAAVDYRLAPEAPAPAAAEDGFAAYVHLHDHTEELGLDASRIGLAGASGGGGVAAATTLMIRDRGAPSPRFLSLNFAMLDDRNETPSSRAIIDVGIFDREASVVAWDAVLAGQAGDEDIDAYRAPARAEDLSGFPPTFVVAAELDVFRDEDLAFAMRLVADEVPTELHLYPGTYHAWDRFAPDSSLAKSFTSAWHAFLRRHLGD